MTDPKRQAQRAARSKTMKGLARAGYTAKGVVYGTVGVLALMVAFGEGGQTTDSRGALRTLAEPTFGKVLLVVLAIGLLGYALWRFAQGFVNVEHEDDDPEGMVYRVSYVISGLIHLALTYFAVRIAFGSGSGGSRGSAASWTGTLMQAPLGRFLVGAIGLAILGYGVYQLYKAFQASFMDKLRRHEMSEEEQRSAKRVGQFGLSARGVVFSLIGGFVIKAALEAQSSEARGLEGALDTLRMQPYGPYLLGVVSAGLVAYGVYCLFLARYRTFPHA